MNNRVRNDLRKRYLKVINYIKDTFEPPGYVHNGKEMFKETDNPENTAEHKQNIDQHWAREKRRVRDVVFESNPKEGCL
eukprot:UN00629